MRTGIRAGACVLLAAAALAAWHADGPKPAMAVPAAPAGARLLSHPAASPALPGRAGDPFGRDPWPDGDVDPFRIVAFEAAPPAPPPQPAAPPAPPAPVAPPFPYRFFGRMMGPDGKLLTYLVRGDTLAQAKAGEALDDEYRVDTIDDAEVVVTYVPLAQRTIINTRGAE